MAASERASSASQPQHANEHQVDESEGHNGAMMLALVGTVMLRPASRKVLLRDGDGVLGTYTHQERGTPIQEVI